MKRSSYSYFHCCGAGPKDFQDAGFRFGLRPFRLSALVFRWRTFVRSPRWSSKDQLVGSDVILEERSQLQSACPASGICSRYVDGPIIPRSTKQSTTRFTVRSWRHSHGRADIDFGRENSESDDFQRVFFPLRSPPSSSAWPSTAHFNPIVSPSSSFSVKRVTAFT